MTDKIRIEANSVDPEQAAPIFNLFVLKEFFEKVDFEKISRQQKSMEQRVFQLNIHVLNYPTCNPKHTLMYSFRPH